MEAIEVGMIDKVDIKKEATTEEETEVIETTDKVVIITEVPSEMISTISKMIIMMETKGTMDKMIKAICIKKVISKFTKEEIEVAEEIMSKSIIIIQKTIILTGWTTGITTSNSQA